LAEEDAIILTSGRKGEAFIGDGEVFYLQFVMTFMIPFIKRKTEIEAGR